MALTYQGKTYDNVADRRVAMEADMVKRGMPVVQPTQPTPPPQTAPMTGSTQPANVTAIKNTLTPDQRDRMYNQLASMDISPSNIGQQDEKTLLEATFSPQELAGMQYYQDISRREAQRTELQQGLMNGQIPQPSTSMLRPLEEALKTKIGLEEESLGQSETFTESGIDPYIALSNSLREKSKEMGDKYKSFSNMMGTVSESLSSSYNQALTTYKILQGQYNTEMERINSVIDGIIENERAINMLRLEDERTKDMYEWKKRVDAKYSTTSDSNSYSGSAYNVSSDVANILALKGGKYGSGVQCAEATNLWSTAPRSGDSWESKIKNKTHMDNPTPGDVMYTPVTVNGALTYGHAAMVLGFDSSTGNVKVSEYNRHGDGKLEFNTYNIDELNASYGQNWGFSDGEIRDKYAAAVASEEVVPDWLKEQLKLYKEGKSQADIEQYIGYTFTDTKEAKYWKKRFDELIHESPIYNTQDATGVVGDVLGLATNNKNVEIKGASAFDIQKEKKDSSITVDDIIDDVPTMEDIAQQMADAGVEEPTPALKKKLINIIKSKLDLEISDEEAARIIYAAKKYID